jgi:hypothetical protein
MEPTKPYSKLFQPKKPDPGYKWWEVLIFIGLIIYIICTLIKIKWSY